MKNLGTEKRNAMHFFNECPSAHRTFPEEKLRLCGLHEQLCQARDDTQNVIRIERAVVLKETLS